MSDHSHKTSDRLKVLPIRVGESPEVIEMANELSEYQKAVGGFIEVVQARTLSKAPCGCEYILIVNEEAVPLGAAYNQIASLLTGLELRGDAILLGQRYDEELEELVWTSLPEGFTEL